MRPLEQEPEPEASTACSALEAGARLHADSRSGLRCSLARKVSLTVLHSVRALALRAHTAMRSSVLVRSTALTLCLAAQRDKFMRHGELLLSAALSAAAAPVLPPAPTELADAAGARGTGGSSGKGGTGGVAEALERCLAVVRFAVGLLADILRFGGWVCVALSRGVACGWL